MNIASPPADADPATDRSAGPSRTPYVEAAAAIAARLVASAVPAGPGVAWDGDDLVGLSSKDVRVVHGPTGPDLYGGAAGIAWFLGHFAQATGSPAIAEIARRGLRFALAEANDKFLDTHQLSLYAGAAGVALAAVEVGSCLADGELQSSGCALAGRIGDLVRRGVEVAEADLIGGVAGIAVGLLAIHRRVPDPMLLASCRIACARLVHQQSYEWGRTSVTFEDAIVAPPLCGLGHGASGIAWALCESAWMSGNRRHLAAAKAATAYERAWFSPVKCAWPDFREPNAQSLTDGRWPGWTNAWCHGALGIGAVRWRMYERTGDTAALAETGAAMHAARVMGANAGADLARRQLPDVTLCHGLGGAAELLMLAYEVSGLVEHRRAARRVGDLCLAVHRANGDRWTYGLRGARTVPGLFTGIAGIGVTMMRLHDSSSIGSPLLAGREPASGPGTRGQALKSSTARRRVPRIARR